MTFRFLHLADLHLDSVYGGNSETVQRLRRATQEAFVAATSLAIQQRLDAVLIAGDAFDDDRLGYESRGIFRRELLRLSKAGVTTVYVTGNHDPGSATGRAAGLCMDAEPGDAPIHLILDAAPRLLRIGKHGTEVCAGLVVAAGHPTSRVTANIVRACEESLGAELAQARGEQERLPAVGVFHTQVTGASGADGHAPYAPSTIGDFASLDLDYAALGHVHVRGRVDPAIPAYYAGNLQGRHAREHGPKGGLLVEVTADGMDDEPEFVPLAPLEFFRCSLKEPRLTPEALGEAILRALDEAQAAGQGPLAAEVVIRADLAIGGKAPLESELELAVLEELRGSPAWAQGRDGAQLLEVQLRVRPPQDTDSASSPNRQELIAQLEGHASALGAAWKECVRRDAHSGSALAEAFLARLERPGERR